MGLEYPRRVREPRQCSSNVIALVLLTISMWCITRFLTFLSPNINCDGIIPDFYCTEQLWRSWGQYSPYFNIPSIISSDVPQNCEVVFAQGLYRHGARDPTFHKSIAYGQMISRIKTDVRQFPDLYAFLKKYEYHLGQDQLSDLGREQLVAAGQDFYDRYQDLARRRWPFVRAAGQERVVESAQKWLSGFRDRHSDDSFSVAQNGWDDILIISEEPGSNNTLSHSLCPSYRNNVGFSAQLEWIQRFGVPIMDRLNRDLPEAQLTLTETLYMMDMCPFESVANTRHRVSDFCRLFTDQEWTAYDYFQSLGKWYGFANGNPMAATQGVGYVNELIARMTGNPVDDHTSVNHTLDSDPTTFPIGSENALFADFSHDNDISSIFSALGIYNWTVPLPTDHSEDIRATHGYSASWTVPFASRAYFEKLQCEGQPEQLVRVLVNGRVLPMEQCGGNALGMCPLSWFVDSLSFARNGGRWDECNSTAEGFLTNLA